VGSFALIFVLLVFTIGTIVWCRIRRRNLRLPTTRAEEEESIPLNVTMSVEDQAGNEDEGEPFRKRKGKERRTPDAIEPPIFDVGEDEEEEGK
jgi:hypothetical protein